ncbi:MAG: DUF166 domain-containing protein [Promethearchaeota archaeon]
MKVYFYSGDQFGERLARNLINDNDFCIGCADACDHCRSMLYGHFGAAIWDFQEVPGDLPSLIDDATPYLPPHVRGADVFIAVAVHPDILVALPEYLVENGVRALIVPAEDPDWINEGLEVTLKEACAQVGLEVAVPRPFCALEKSTADDPRPTIDAFMDEFKIGDPVLHLEIRKNQIVGGSVVRSQPCGAAYYILKQLIGQRVTNDGTSLEEKISKAHHSYPCSASMKTDRALNDTPLHFGGYIIRNAVYRAIQDFYARRRKLNGRRNGRRGQYERNGQNGGSCGGGKATEGSPTLRLENSDKR